MALMTAAPAASLAASAGFGVSPLRFDVDTSAGSSSSHSITITNTDSRSATFSFSREDYQGDRRDPEATPRLLGGKFESEISAHDWLSVPAAVTVPAGQSRAVKVDLNVPAGATGGHYAAVVVNGPDRAAGQLVARSRIAVLFLVNAGGAPPPDIVVRQVTEFTDGGTRIVYRNEGTTHTAPDATITYTDPVTGNPVERVTTECSTALPGSVGECTFSGNGRAAAEEETSLGGSGASVELVTDEGRRARAELPTEWAGTWSSLLLPMAGLSLFALYFGFVRRRGAGVDAAPDG